MIEVKDLHKSFGKTSVLKGISTSFERGKTNLIIGQSGSGKTVFLKSILGLFTPEKGEIVFDGNPMGEMNQEERSTLREDMGMVFFKAARCLIL